MEIIRKFKKLSTPRLLELVEFEMTAELELSQFTEYFDELKMRKLESISEGEIFKIKRAAKNLLAHLEKLVQQNESWQQRESEISRLRDLAALV